MFKIVTGIPLPVASRGRKAVDLPLDQMESGESFLIPLDVTDKKAIESWRRKVLASKKRVLKTHPEAAYRTAVVNDEHGTGLRVWCTA